MRNPREVKFFLVLLICTVFIFSFSTYGAMAYDHFFNEANQYPESTKIGSVDIAGLDAKEALVTLKEKQQTWKKKTTIIFLYNEKSVKVNLDMFAFDIEQSLQAAKSNVQTELQVTINSQELANYLEKLNLTNNKVDITRLKADLSGYTSLLSTGTHTLQLNKYLLKKPPVTILSESTVPFTEAAFELKNWAERFPTITIKPTSSVSIMQLLEENRLKNLSDDSLSMIATAIYKVVLPTNFLITERHISRELPSYAEAGYEAKIDQNNNMDLVFTNPNQQEYQLKFKIINNKLFYVALKGAKFSYSYTVLLKDKETFQPKTIIQYDAQLADNSERLKTAGQEGILVKVYRHKVDESGNTLEKTLIDEDFYPPQNKVIIRSLEKTETETVSDDDTNAADQTEDGKTETATEEDTASNKETNQTSKDKSDSTKNSNVTDKTNSNDHSK
ncbi:VanW family protein [Bacillus rubiinfantis]|uniref:VanW family protein n=1 Tax=Bacillus rubiinfantis TaxID=1499680 RepID=UPI0005A9F6F3|nr:VanW family protein [Bacillus rubiinfantis]